MMELLFKLYDPKILNKVMWALVVCVFLLSGWLLNNGIDVSELTAPNTNSGNNVLVEEAQRLIKEYGDLVTKIGAHRDIWSSVVVVIASLGAIAVALRAPQFLIIITGGYSAFVYGMLEVKSPQKHVEAISIARHSMTCTLSMLSVHSTSSEIFGDEVSPLKRTIRLNAENLESYISNLEVYSKRLIEVLDITSRQATDSIRNIDLALMKPHQNFSPEIKKLFSLLREVEVLSEVAQHKAEVNNRTQLLRRIESVMELIQEAVEALSKPEEMRSKFTQGQDSYYEVLSSANEISVISKMAITKAEFVLARKDEAITSIDDWERSLEAVDLALRQAVANIHSNLLQDLVKAGVTNEVLVSIVGSLGSQLVTSDSHARLSDGRVSDVPKLSTVNLQEAILDVEMRAENQIKSYAGRISAAIKEFEELEKFAGTDLNLIENVTSLILVPTEELSVNIGQKRDKVLQAYKAINKFSELRALYGAEDLLTDIHLCLPQGSRWADSSSI